MHVKSQIRKTGKPIHSHRKNKIIDKLNEIIDNLDRKLEQNRKSQGHHVPYIKALHRKLQLVPTEEECKLVISLMLKRFNIGIESKQLLVLRDYLDGKIDEHDPFFHKVKRD